MAEHKIEVSATELPQFRRLVEFVAQVGVHADAHEDEELREMVRECRVDLLDMKSPPFEECA